MASSASRYSGKLSHCHWMPSASAVPGMSSTPSISSISHWRRSGLAGAKPTPQLPITTVVTPFQPEGERYGIPGDLTVVVGVDVDPAGCHQVSLGVDLAPGGAHVCSHRADAIAVDRDVALARRRARAVDEQASPDHQIVHRVSSQR